MKNNIYKFFFTICIIIFGQNNLLAENLEINSSKIKVDKNTKIVVFEGNVNANDNKNNNLFADFAKYEKDKELLETTGNTRILTSEGFELEGTDVLFDNEKKIISSNKKAIIKDKDGNKIYVEMFNYIIQKNIFFSKGKISITDINNNEYFFSEIYIDEKKQKIVGSDVKAFLNQNDVKINEDNEPRFFANTSIISKEESIFEKGVFTYCKNRGEGKCPPWILQSEKIKHSSAKKTVFYHNAILKVYDFPVFYFPRFSHPDPSVDRRSGFLPPSFTNSSTIGSGISVPYFWSISRDKDLTFSPRIYTTENPLLLDEYRQAFANSFLILAGGYGGGYKKTTEKKTSGARSHIFTRFVKNFNHQENQSSNLELNIQKVSNDTYLKIHDINTSLAEDDIEVLNNSMSYKYEDEDLFFGTSFSAYEDTTKTGNSRYEYILPELIFNKNLVSNKSYGALDFSSSLKVRNYDVNKQTEIFVNDLNWTSKKWISDIGAENQFIGLLKTINYNASNTPEYKSENKESQLSGVIGYLSKLTFFKSDLEKRTNQLLTPRFLVRYAPGHMRDLDKGNLDYLNLYSLNKFKDIDTVESGLSASIGFDYKTNSLNEDGTLGNEKFSFSAGQVVSERENFDMPSSSSLDQKFSDVVGESSFKFNDNFSIGYDFAIDQNLKQFNYSDVKADFVLGNSKFNMSYLEERNHRGSSQYLESTAEISINEFNNLSFSTKRNLLTDSADFYNLSYSYINDCLKAGVVFRREFYTDRDIEPENSLMFKVSIFPFAGISSPLFNK